MDETLVLMQGNEAVVEGALAAGMRFYAGYPITPSTEIAERSALRLPQVGGHFMQMEDEISSIAAVIGASAVGCKAMTATSGPGFSLKQENIGYAAMAELPCVIVNVQRFGPSTGLPTSPAQGDVMQARWGSHGDYPLIAIAPSSVEECYTLAIRSFNLAERYRVPVILLMDEIVGHMREGIHFPYPEEPEIVNRTMPDREDENWLPYRADADGVPKLPPFGMGWRYHITGLAHAETGYPTNSPEVAGKLSARLMKKITEHVDDIVTWKEYVPEDTEKVLFCFGGTVRAARQAVKEARERGMKVGLFQAITIWPFPEKQVRALSRKVKHILVAEHNHGQLLLEVQRVAEPDCEISFMGKTDGSGITPHELLDALCKVVRTEKKVNENNA